MNSTPKWHFAISVHVSRSTIGTCWRSNFFVHFSNPLTLTLSSVFHYFSYAKTSLSIFTKTLSSLSSKLKPSNLNIRKVWFLFTDCFVIYHFAACNKLITAWDCLWLSHFFAHSFPLFISRVSVFMVFSGFVKLRHLFL